MKNFVGQFIRDESGAIAFEYCLIFTIMVVANMSWMALVNGKLIDAVSDLPSYAN